MANVYMGKDVEDFIFNEGTEYGENGYNVTDEEINQFGVIECVDEPEVAGYRIALENEQNYNMIMNAMMVQEMNYLVENGTEMVYESGKIANFFDKIGEMVKKFWSKCMGVFKKVQDFISSMVFSNKAFIKKYKGKDFKIPTDGKTFKGYEIIADAAKTDFYGDIAETAMGEIDMSKLVKTGEEAANSYIEKFRKDFDSMKDLLRGAACGTTSVKSNEYNKSLQKYYFGSEEKVTLKLKPFSTLIESLETGKKEKAEVQHAYKQAKNAVKSMINAIKIAKNACLKIEGRKENYVSKIAKCYSDSLSAAISIMSVAQSYQCRAITTRMRQDRSMAAYYVGHQPSEKKDDKAEVTSESFLEFELI